MTKSLFDIAPNPDNTSNVSDKATKEAKKKLKDTRKGIQGKEIVKERNTSNKKNNLPVVANEVLGLESTVEPVTANQVKKLYPKKINDDTCKLIAEMINKAIEPMEQEYGLGQFFKETTIGFMDILSDNNTNTYQEYINASKFITFRQAGDTLVRAYSKTFPDRVRRMEEDNTPLSYLATYAQVFSKGKLVTKLQAQVAVPVHILYQDVFHKAVQTQAEIMLDDKVSPKVRSDAANSLLTHLKTPEVKQMELDVKIRQTSEITDLAKAMRDLATSQHQHIEGGFIDITDVNDAVIYTEEETNEDFG